jgi:hypothetical protein
VTFRLESLTRYSSFSKLELGIMPENRPKVFISYNKADRDWAEWIAGVIEGAGYEPILQAWHFRPGENFVLRMHEATAETNITIAVLSEAYLKAEYTQPEWAAAFARDPKGKERHLIPVRVTACSPTGLLAQIIYVDLVGLNEHDAERALLKAWVISLSSAPLEK